MHSKLPDIEIPLDDPFANDKLQRRESGEILSRFLQAVPTPYVLAIDAQWGQGKTTFLRMWKQLLQNDGFPVHYFNAWEADYESDPMVALMGEIRSFTKQLATKSSPKERTE